MITFDVFLCTLVDRRRSGVHGRGSGSMNAGASLDIFGRAPGILLRVCLRCMCAVLIKLRFAVGSLVCINAGESVIRWIVTMGASSLGLLSRTISVPTLCSSSCGGARMALIALPRLLMRFRPLVVPAANFVLCCNSSVSALRCAVGLRFGTWQCCGKSSADPEIRYARVSGTKYKLHR